MRHVVGKLSAVTLACMISIATPAIAAELEIPAGELISALKSLSAQLDIELVYQPEQLRNLRTDGVRGTYSPQEAIAILLKGTALEVRTDTSGAMVIAPRKSEGPSETSGAAAESKEVLEQVVVTGTHIRGVTPSSPVITISQLDIERSGYHSTGDLVRNLPQSFAGGMNATVVQAGGGSQNQNQYSGASSVNLRGFGSESTLTLVNGHRLASSDNLSAVDVSVIPLAAIDHVDVLADGASALYGSDAVAGVVNFVLKKNFTGIETRASYGDTSSGGGSSQLYSLLAGKNWASGSATLSYEHAQQQPIFAQDRSFTSPDIPGMSLLPRTRRDSLFATAEHDVGEKLGLFVQGLYTKRSSHQYVDYRALQGAFSETDADVSQHGITAGATLRLSDAWRITLSANHSKTSADAPQRVSFTEAPEFDFSLAQRFENELEQIDLKADGRLADLPAGPLALAVGASYREESFLEIQEFEGAPPPITDIDAKRDVTSAFAELNVPIIAGDGSGGAPRLSFVAAARYDEYSDSGSSAVPKLGLVYAPRQDLQLKASWSKSFRAPTLSQEYTAPVASLAYDADPFVPEGNSFKIYLGGGNATLEPETSTSTTLSALFSPAWLEGGSVHLTYYHIDYSDRIVIPLQGFTAYADPANSAYIIRDPTLQQLEAALAGASFFNNSGFPYDPAAVVAIADGRFLNASQQVAQGVDLLTQYQHRTGAGELGFVLNATWLDLTQKISSATPEQTLSATVFNPPRFRARAGVNWQAASLSASAYLNFVGRFTNPVVTPAERISAWTTADAQVAYDLPAAAWAKRAQLSLAVQNLFDRAPPAINALSTTPPGVQYDSTNASPLGRFVSLTAVLGW